MNVIAMFIVFALIVSLGVLIAGSISMAKGGQFDEAHSFPLMEAEVILQAIVVGMLLIAALVW